MSQLVGTMVVVALALLVADGPRRLAGAASAPPAGGDAKISILPLGDSITGKFGQVSYRYWLWQGLRESGWTGIDYVGTLKDPWSSGFDPDHEGHGSWSARALLHGRPDHPEEGKVETWVAGMNPDVVLMLMGTNDLLSRVCLLKQRTCDADEQTAELRRGEAEALEAMTGIIEVLRRRNPKVAIVLAQIPPSVWVSSSEVRRFNDEGIAALARRLDTPTSPVVTVDLQEGFVVPPRAPDTDTTDGIHPNVDGAKKIAARFMKVLIGQVFPHVLAQRRAGGE